MARTLTHAARFAGLALAAGALVGCSEPVQTGYERVTIDGRTFTLKVAADNETRVKGLGGVERIEPGGGMLFIFPRATRRQFLMRDCLIDIDIIFLDANARIVAMHHMPAEPPQSEDESLLAYESRLPKYPSRFDSQFVIELQGGMLETLDISDGQKLELDTDRLRSLAR